VSQYYSWNYDALHGWDNVFQLFEDSQAYSISYIPGAQAYWMPYSFNHTFTSYNFEKLSSANFADIGFQAEVTGL